MQRLTKDLDVCTHQRHASLGFDKMYVSLVEAGIVVQDHAHDRNASINKKIQNERDGTTN